jgi:hypothetical protein
MALQLIFGVLPLPPASCQVYRGRTGFAETFNSLLRVEFLSHELFLTVAEANGLSIHLDQLCKNAGII